MPSLPSKIISSKRADHKRSSQGFNLIELMVTVAVMSILTLTVGSMIGWQTRSFMAAMSSNKLNDRARGLKNLFRDDGHRAGLGFALDVNAAGWRATGDCLSPNSLQLGEIVEDNCAKRDANGMGDRLQFTYGDPTAWPWVASSSNPSLGPCIGSTDVSNGNTLMISQNDLLPTSQGTLFSQGCYLIAGDCVGDAGAPSATIIVCSAPEYPLGQNVRGCAWAVQTYYEFYGRDSAHGCTSGWMPGFRLLQYAVAAYQMTPDQTGTTFNLVRRNLYREDVIMATNVNNFIVTYGIDLSDPMDGKLDECDTCTDDPYQSIVGRTLSWCRDLNSGCGLTTTQGDPISHDSLYNRIIAVHVSFDLFDQDPNAAVTYSTVVSMKNKLTP